MSGPAIDRAASSGDIWTPWEFMRAVEKKFGPVYADLACTTINKRAERGLCYDEGTDSLRVNWADYLKGGLGWDNCPYSTITPWARYHAQQHTLGARTLLLVPGSVGANWYWDFVEPFATVYSVGRMVFDNCFDRKTGALVRTVYPKDLILCHYDPHESSPGRMQRWLWKAS